MERTDVVELEPAILDVARLCAPVNRRALDNPRVHVTTGDAREVLMTGRGQYDLVFSEPSNPYRAGIASLFTREFYQAVDSRLSPDGLFLQWVQAYEVDERTIATILATLATVFPRGGGLAGPQRRPRARGLAAAAAPRRRPPDGAHAARSRSRARCATPGA